jgi:hypothetical protein
VETVEHIAGANQLVAVFGYWPSFHDAEMLWLRLDRRAHGDGCYGPTLEALVHAFEMTSEVGADGSYVLRHHVLVHLRFLDVVELRLEEFNFQNALMGLTITDLRDRQMERVRWAAHFESAFGVDASFQCYAVEVVSVIPCSNVGEPIHAEPAGAPESGRDAR